LPAFLFSERILFRDGIHAEDAKKVCCAAHFDKPGFEVGRRLGHEIEEELIGPGCAMNRAAFDFHQVDTVASERFQGGEQRARFVRNSERDRHFQQWRCNRLFRLSHL